MSNTSATGGYLLPGTPAPLPANLTFKQFLQTVFVGVSGLSPDLVRPRWQVQPPKQPDINTNWMALGITMVQPDANAYVGLSGPTFASGFIQIKCNPKASDTVTVNGTVITFVSTLTTGNQVLIGTDAATTSANLNTFLQASLISNLTQASYSVLSNVVSITFNTSGTSGNAFTLATSTQVILLSGSNLIGGATSPNTTQRHEELEVQCAFYGPSAYEYSGIVRDGFQIPQNLEALRSANMGFKGTNQAIHVPDLTNERWIDRYEMSVFFRREIMRSYSILSLLSVSGSVQAEITSGIKTVDWIVNG